MEMSLWPRSPLCPRGRQPLVVVVCPAGLAQPFWMNGRFTRSRTVRCMVASSDSPNRKSRRLVSPQVKVISSRGYTTRLIVEPSTENTEHNNGDEEILDTYNALLHTEAAEWTDTREAETAEADSSQNASSSSIIRELDAADEDILAVDLTVNALSSVTKREVDAADKARVEEDVFELDLPATTLRSVIVDVIDDNGTVQETLRSVIVDVTDDVADKARVEEDIFELDFSGNVSSSATTVELDAVDEVGPVQDTFEASLSGNVSNSATVQEVDAVDEAGNDQDIFKADLSGNIFSSSTTVEVGVVDEAGSTKDRFEMDSSGNVSTSATMWDAIDEAVADQDAVEADLSGNASSWATYRELDDVVDENRSEEETFVMDLVGEATDEEENYQQQYPVPSSFSMWDKAIAKTGVSLNPEPRLTSVQEQGKVNFSDKQDLSIADLPGQNQSIVGSCKQDKSIADVAGPPQSIFGSSKQHRPIVAFRKQNHSIVSDPKQKQSIVGFRSQDLSAVDLPKQNIPIVGTSSEGQTKQVPVVDRQDALYVNGLELKEGDHRSEKTDEDVLHVKFNIDNVLQKHLADRTQAVETTIWKEVDEEHLYMTEHQIGSTEGHMVLNEDELSITEIGMGSGDKIQHALSEEELSWSEDEVQLNKDDGQYEVDETSASFTVEQDIQGPPQDVVDPQALRAMLQELADKNYSMRNKLFVFPEVVKADSVIDLYLNRDLTALANEPDVVIKGAFNGWKWKLFSERLHKSDLGGVWWSCKLHIPKEAYRLDFVFFNGRTVYENNGNNDFCIGIEGTMNEDLFEDFLVKEKQRELEKLAMEEAERRTQTDEQRRRKEARAADEAVRAQAKAEIEIKKNKLHSMLSLARTCDDNLWYIEASTDTRGDTIRLYYNRNSRPLAHSTEIWMHGGYNNWTDGLSIVESFVKCNDEDGDWWYADVILPEKALVLDWVFADGPAGNARNYDNNSRKDFHAIIPNKNVTKKGFWVQEEQNIYTRLLQERREKEEIMRRKAERSANMKAEMKAKTMRRFLLSQKHIVYTEPLEVRAGTAVDVLYNPSNTVLNGKTEVWFRCSFNLWMHPSGALPPQKMVKSGDGSLLKATVNVPPDAYMMDFVFSESDENGIYDNRNGMDYHIPVSDSIETENYMRIIHIAVEMAPVAKVGGLGDVVTSLSRAVQDLGHTVEVILPKYDCLNQSSVKDLHLYQSFSWSGTEIKVWVGQVENLTVYFLEPQNGMFGVGCVYGRNDDRRFGFFCHSALEFILQNGLSPHIIHCHDWSSAPVAWLYKEHYSQSRMASTRVVFTIHNLEFGAHYIGKAMTYCDKATTVSPTYSREVAGHGAIAPHREKFYGILNGIDPDIWDPYTDNFIPVPYTYENVVEGKSAAKRALQQKFGLQQTDVPVVGIITRLTAQKGIHLIKHAIHQTLESNGQVVLLGSAPDHRIQGDFCRLADALHGVYHGRVKLVLTYDEPLSHLIYAGSDFIRVPSIFEPCGLTQLVAMRYGSIPIVRKTGGLHDTVFDVDNDKERARSLGLEPNGFSFDGADSNGVDYALNRAIAAWFDARDWFHSLCKRVMEQDWSWNRPALDYIELYHAARKF
uniref:starch synthase n=1 Tax=Hordeum vulgare subsp. vulgare TaxID=112509 RepID=G1FUQ4_HORVV|nr:starch synthase IIIa [Hordeum vulgare subsp. vulgare]AEL97586.1 starch synthase IIIa [Hordeum vulgare subsp. vulgare]